MQLPPQSLLQGLVKHYLVLRQQANTQQQYRMFSDGNPGIVFHLKDQLMQWNEGDMKPQLQPRSFVYGQLSHYNTIASSGDMAMIVVVLQPHSLFTHFHIPANELKDHTVSLVDIFGQAARDLEEQVGSALTVDAAISVIEAFLLKRLNGLTDFSGEVSMALNAIYQHQGILSISALLDKIPVTERQLERKFLQYVGTTPKRFAETIKFQHLLKLLKKQSDKEKIAALIYASGYYDQAHLNNIFKRMTGLTPNHYKDASQLLAINFMTIS